MKSHWQVIKITDTGTKTVDLAQVEWFKRNPEFDRLADVVGADMPDEFLSAEPGETGADCVALGGRMTIEIGTDDPQLGWGDDVTIDLNVTVPA